MLDAGFQALVEVNYAKVFFHCVKLVKSEHDAADITQNTFLKAFMAFGGVRKRESLEPWLFVICNNEIRQFYRNSPKTATVPELYAATEFDDGHSHVVLYSAIDRLPEAQRQAVLLKYFAGYTMGELSLVLSVRLCTVKSRLYEARQSLKLLLDTDDLTTLPDFQVFQKERRHYLMLILNLCAVGAKTIPCMSLRTQKELLRCAKENAKFSTMVLAELADIPSGQEFLDACGGSLSYGELIKVLACVDEATLYRISGQEYKTWRNATGNRLISDVAALYRTGGYVDSVEPILFVPSIRETTEWYRKYLNWCSGDADDNEKWGHAAIHPYSDDSAEPQYRDFKGFHLRQNQGGKVEGCGFFVFVSGLEALRDTIIETGWDKVGEIYHQCWGAKVFELTDLNGFYIEFCEWEC